MSIANSMSIPKWLSILALTGSMSLVSSKARAETVMQPIIFPDPLEEIIPDRKANANLFISAVNLGQGKINFAVDGIDCSLVPGSCKLRLALPHDTEINEIIQQGLIKTPGRLWGTNAEKIPLFPNEGYQRAVRVLEILGTGAAAEATVPMYGLKKVDDIARIVLFGKTQSQEYAEKLRKTIHNLSLLAIPEYTPKNPLGPRKYFSSRSFDFRLSRDPDLAFGVLSLVVTDKNDRRFAIDDLVVCFNDIPKRTVRPVVGRTPGGIEDLLLQNDPELRLKKHWEDLGIIEYSFPAGFVDLDLYVAVLDKKYGTSLEKVEKALGERITKMWETRYPHMMPHYGASLFGIETEDKIIFYLGSVPAPILEKWREEKRRITAEELNIIVTKLNSIKEMAKKSGKQYVDEEKYLRQLAGLNN